MHVDFQLGTEDLTVDLLDFWSKQKNIQFHLKNEAFLKTKKHRDLIEKSMVENKTVYGVNTGFGFLSHIKIQKEDLKKLQLNLIRSHACGMGKPLFQEAVRALLILKAHNLLKGHSGVTKSCVEKILDLIQHDILPVIPTQGSVGASGDLAPLAHMALTLIGEGEAYFDGERQDTAALFRRLNWEPYTPECKEGLSLINGTQYMTALGALVLKQAKNIFESGLKIAALSIDGFRASITPFDVRIHSIRGHKGQSYVAKKMREYFSGFDEILESHKDCNKVQDPYSFRCIPQVYGASYDTFQFVENTLNIELNSVTDNPLVFDDGAILSGGNFHGEPVAMALDYLAIAISELGSLSERRTEKLTNPHMSGLSAFLVKNEGLNSGFMIPQVVAAALASENKVHCHPASVDSIPTSAEKEDHVSMGPISAHKALRVASNTAKIFAIELVAACQALDLLKPLKPSPQLLALYDKVRTVVPFMDDDRSLSAQLETIAEMIIKGEFIEETTF